MSNIERVPLLAFTGPEGSGKTTQAKLLAQTLGLPYASTGDIIRAAADNDSTELGDACREMFARHNYLSPLLLLKILAKRLQEDDARCGIVLDGGFRTVEETEKFQSMLEETQRDFSVMVIYLRIPGWEGIQRALAGRRRPDDTSEALLSRLSSFYTGLGERMSFIRKKWPLFIINGRRPIEEINQEILSLTREQPSSWAIGDGPKRY